MIASDAIQQGWCNEHRLAILSHFELEACKYNLTRASVGKLRQSIVLVYKSDKESSLFIGLPNWRAPLDSESACLAEW